MPGTYGPGCSGNCICQNNATCDKMDGSCDCQRGWTGVECNNPCPAGYYGKNCQSKCKCLNMASCDAVTGSCTCIGEWQGDLCDVSKSITYHFIIYLYKYLYIYLDSVKCIYILVPTIYRPGARNISLLILSLFQNFNRFGLFSRSLYILRTLMITWTLRRC